jgi:hypothetical protein
MAPRPIVTCLLPGLFGPVPAGASAAVQDTGPYPNLQWLLARSRHRPGTVAASTEALLARVCGIDGPTGGLMAASLADAPRNPDAIHYRASPAHLQPDRDRLLLFAGAPVRPDDADRCEIAERFNVLYRDDGLRLSPVGDEWLLTAETPPGPNLPRLGKVTGRYLDTALPAGSDYRRWRQILNETQMMLFDHPANTRRAQRGALAINGLWFWDGAPVAGPLSAAFDRCIGDHPLVAAIARLSGVEHQSLTALETSAPAPGGRWLVVGDASEKALLGGDIGGWLDALQWVERELAPLMANWMARHGAEIRLHPGNGRGYCLHRRNRWRVWRRRSRPADQLVEQ